MPLQGTPSNCNRRRGNGNHEQNRIQQKQIDSDVALAAAEHPCVHQVFVHSVTGPEHCCDRDGTPSPKVPEKGEGARNGESCPRIFDEHAEQFRAARSSCDFGAHRSQESVE